MAQQMIPFADEWKANKEDMYFTTAKDVIICPLNEYFHTGDNNRINFFWIKPKRSYTSDLLREHCCHYLNYFEKFFFFF